MDEEDEEIPQNDATEDGISMEEYPSKNGYLADESEFEQITKQALAGVDDEELGYSSYDLISRTLHQLARDGNYQLLSLALDRLGDQAKKRINKLDEACLAPLHYASRYAHPITVRTLLQKNAYINIKGLDGLTPLHCAARYRKSLKSARKRRSPRPSKGSLFLHEVEAASDENTLKEPDLNSLTDFSSGTDEVQEDSVVKILVENGADLNAKDVYGMTPLHYAAARGNDVAARDLLNCAGLDIENRDKQLLTPLSIAATYGFVDICRRLIKADAQISTTDESRQTPLHRAAAEGHLEIVELLLSAAMLDGGSEEVERLLALKDAEKQQPLHVAVMNGNTQIISLLLKKGAEINAVRDNLSTPLHAAASVGDSEIVEILLRHGAHINAVDSNQQSALHKAAENNQSDIIDVLLDHNATIEKKDKDSFTPLLLAVASGRPAATYTLIQRGASLAEVDKDEKTAVFWAAQEGHVETLRILLEESICRDFVDVSDRFDNSPLHEAAGQGYVKVLRHLLDAGSQIDNKNEDEETALHVASEQGQINVVRELLMRHRFLASDENEDANTPLHLAALKGHMEVVELLLDNGADVEARNTALWTPLDCASSNGHVEVCRVLLEHDSPLDPLDKSKSTPLQLAAKSGHVEVTSLLLEKGASVAARNVNDRNALEVAIVNGRKEVALAIVRSEQWLMALRSVREDPNHPTRRLTPFRLLITKFPDVAEVVLDRCMKSEGSDPEHIDYQIRFNYEFVDDTYEMVDSVDSDVDSLLSLSNTAFDEEGKLLDEAEPYTASPQVLKKNHPLMLMVKYNRSSLLAHPVPMSLVRHKWKSYGRFVYYSNLVFYTIFLIFLTSYVVNSIDWSYALHLLGQMNATETLSSRMTYEWNTETCLRVEEILNYETGTYWTICKYAIIAMALLNIFRELVQFYTSRMNYLGIENLLEWLCYIGAVLLVWDWNSNIGCSIREAWQWQVGSVVIFLAWLNLLLTLRKLPFFGIYVVMFTEILSTFTKFFVVFFLFIIGFALSFFMVFRTQLPFEKVGKSMLKTSIMMIGEFDIPFIYEGKDINTFPYPAVSYILFVVFFILMSILIMNLLVGLAVDDIKAVQDQARLKRLAMQTMLILDVEVLIPDKIRRLFSRSYKFVRPNKGTSYKSIFGDFQLLQTYDYTQVDQQGMQSEKEEMQQNVEQLTTQIEDLRQQNQKLIQLFTKMVGFRMKESNMDIDERL